MGRMQSGHLHGAGKRRGGGSGSGFLALSAGGGNGEPECGVLLGRVLSIRHRHGSGCGKGCRVILQGGGIRFAPRTDAARPRLPRRDRRGSRRCRGRALGARGGVSALR